MLNRIIIILYKILRKIIILFGVPLHFSSDGEDFILHKIFSKLKNGYYIDIGSHHPILHSNTFLFYLNGWRGVCVDPLPNLIWKYKNNVFQMIIVLVIHLLKKTLDFLNYPQEKH